MINYSIIIPHKNVPKLLQRCLNSIPIRDDMQVIVIDDNSDADKVDFNNFPKWNGKNYEYHLTKEGKGAGYACNIKGLSMHNRFFKLNSTNKTTIEQTKSKDYYSPFKISNKEIHLIGINFSTETRNIQEYIVETMN